MWNVRKVLVLLCTHVAAGALAALAVQEVWKDFVRRQSQGLTDTITLSVSNLPEVTAAAVRIQNAHRGKLARKQLQTFRRQKAGGAQPVTPDKQGHDISQDIPVSACSPRNRLSHQLAILKLPAPLLFAESLTGWKGREHRDGEGTLIPDTVAEGSIYTYRFTVQPSQIVRVEVQYAHCPAETDVGYRFNVARGRAIRFEGRATAEGAALLERGSLSSAELEMNLAGAAADSRHPVDAVDPGQEASDEQIADPGQDQLRLEGREGTLEFVFDNSHSWLWQKEVVLLLQQVYTVPVVELKDSSGQTDESGDHRALAYEREAVEHFNNVKIQEWGAIFDDLRQKTGFTAVLPHVLELLPRDMNAPPPLPATLALPTMKLLRGVIAIVGIALNVFTITIGFVKHRKYLVLALWSRSLGGADESFLQYLHSADSDNLKNVLVSCLVSPSPALKRALL
jgi:hypothetical protein